MAEPTSQGNMIGHWHKTRNLMWICLAIWFFFSFVIHLFAPSLNSITFIGFPLGFYMAAQGSLIVFVVLSSGTRARRTRSTKNSASTKTR